MGVSGGQKGKRTKKRNRCMLKDKSMTELFKESIGVRGSLKRRLSGYERDRKRQEILLMDRLNEKDVLVRSLGATKLPNFQYPSRRKKIL